MFFNSENGGNMFLQNIGLLSTALHCRRQNYLRNFYMKKTQHGTVQFRRQEYAPAIFRTEQFYLSIKPYSITSSRTVILTLTALRTVHFRKQIMCGSSGKHISASLESLTNIHSCNKESHQGGDRVELLYGT
jgi:hypothetical protein